ncbi:MAG TPA: tetratricopeptide repeat protein [Pyrinomonadaceae bacterium]|jgi:tetratricopeptide (TPR) repeat protein
MKTFHPQTKISFENLVKLERCGLYEQALAELKDVWRDTNEPPDTANCTPLEAAEIILRCGSLIGFHGHNKQIPDAQEKSKNLLTEARQRFLDFNNVEKIAECENYLALAYWRTGEFNESETFVAEALLHPLSNSCRTRLYSHLIKKIISNVTGEYAATVADAEELENDFRRFGDAFLNGSFCTNVGIALKNLGRTVEALKKFELARYYHQKSRHQIYLGTVENNLAQLYKAGKQFSQAHEAANAATKIFKRVKDRTREGFSLDTKAQVYFAEGKYAEALKAIEKAIEILKKSENSAYLSETYLTKAKILLYSDGFTAAALVLFEAVKIVEVNIGEAAARNLITEFEETLSEKNKPVENAPNEDSGKEKLELIMPPSLAHYDEIQAVHINNEYLENVGLPKNSFAVVAQIEIKRGDLAAVNELATDTVVCGFYDAEFGIVCLEAKSGEPHLFDENEITVLGKIVGVCCSDKTTDGKIVVEPLEF